jgi:D-glycero-D-manno-heptose 1,7-bisphosphate phosphatase
MVSGDAGAKAVFLDRDGVLVVPQFRDGRSFAPQRLEDFRLYDGSRAAVSRLKAAGFVVVVATNQPDVGAGIVAERVIEAMHSRLRAEVPVDDIETCFDTRAHATERRKPAAGMLFDAARKWQVDLGTSYVVGDRHTDVEAGIRAGCTSVFIDHSYAAEVKPTAQSATVRNLTEAVDWILREDLRRTAADRRP